MKKIRAHRGSSLVEHPSAWTAHLARHRR
jgi:hypothetical protein